MSPDHPSADSPQPARPAQPVQAQVVAPPAKFVLEQKAPLLGRLGKVLLVLLVISVMVIAGQYARYQSYFNPSTAPLEKYHSLSKTAKKKIAILTVRGAILDGEGYVKQQIERVRKDKNVVGLVLRIDSPGGTVTGSDYLYHHLRQLREDRKLPMVVSMGSLCASGGYYIAMAAGDHPDVIFAEPTTWTGSIGVVIPHYDFSELLEHWKVTDDSIASHPYKLMGSPTRLLSEDQRAEERAMLQNLVDESFAMFKEIVRRGRPQLAKDERALDAVATGQIFTASQAKKNGLIDQIGFMDIAIARATELAGYDKDEVRCVKYQRPPGALDLLLGTSAESLLPSRGVDVAGLLDLTAPRAYYLSTWLPAVLKNSP